VACFNPDDISLTDGALPDRTVYEEVPYIRFQKSFSSRIEALGKERSLPGFFKEKERTVFVVNAGKFDEFMREWDIVNMVKEGPSLEGLLY